MDFAKTDVPKQLEKKTINVVIFFLFVDERDRVQKKTFTKWINQHLFKVRHVIWQ